MRVVRCNRDLYPGFLSAVNTCFGNEQGWFCKNVGHCCPWPEAAEDLEISQNIVTLDNDKVVGTIGVYPRQWLVTDGELTTTLNIAGIGQVGCLPNERGRGIMSQMLNFAISEMEKEGCDASWLSGDRFRYRNYGWDHAGTKLCLNFAQWRLSAMTNDLKLTKREASLDDLSILQPLYETYSTRTLRDAKWWSKLLNRQNFHWIIGEVGGQTAYICYNDLYPEHIGEARGDGKALLALLKDHMQEKNLQRVEYSAPELDATTQGIIDFASYFSFAPATQIKLVNIPSLFEKLKPFAEKQNAQLTTAACSDLEKQAEICSMLLGFDLQKNPLRPVKLWLPAPDDV